MNPKIFSYHIKIFRNSLYIFKKTPPPQTSKEFP